MGESIVDGMIYDVHVCSVLPKVTRKEGGGGMGVVGLDIKELIILQSPLQRIFTKERGGEHPLPPFGGNTGSSVILFKAVCVEVAVLPPPGGDN